MRSVGGGDLKHQRRKRCEPQPLWYLVTQNAVTFGNDRIVPTATALPGNHEDEPQPVRMGPQDESAQDIMRVRGGHSVKIEARLRLELSPDHPFECLAIHGEALASGRGRRFEAEARLARPSTRTKRNARWHIIAGYRIGGQVFRCGLALL